MPFLPRRAASLRRAVPIAVLATSVLALPSGALAADSLGPGGVVIPGSALAVGVSGATNTAGSVQARFSAVGTPLFWGPNTTNMNDGTSAVFALNTPYGLYSSQSTVPVDNAPFTQTQAPALTGTGTAGDPYVVVSKFDANAGVHITQTITHVSGTTSFTGTWAVTNGTGSPSNFQGFEGADLYVNGNDSGTGTQTGTAPNRVLGSVAPDGTQAQIVEQAVSPWTHYFTGMNNPFYAATGDSTYGDLPDTVDPTLKDSGEAVGWNFTLANGATKTMSIVWNFTSPALPQAPQITGGVPAQNGRTNSTTVQPAFTYATGDAANSVGFQCALDGGAFSTCTAPKTVSGLADGSHTFSVRATNSAGQPGPQTDRTFTVDTTPPGAPSIGGAPTGTVNSAAASISITGESGATLKCSVDGSSYVTCSSPVTISGLADGPHTFSVKQIDAAGNAGTAVATASWTVDTVAPGTPTVGGAPTGTVASADASLTLTGAEPGGTFTCSVDGAAYATCTSPLTLSGLADGAHTVAVKQVDAAGNASATPASKSWTVDTSVPATPTTDSAPAATTTDTTATVTFVTPAGLTAECALDGGAYQACTSPVQRSGVAVGVHTLKLRFLNALGTPSAPRTVSWEVKAEAPPTDPTPTPTAPASPTPTAPAVLAPKPAAPSAPEQCVSRRVVTLSWILPKGAKVKGFKLLVDGKVVQRLSAKTRSAKVSLVGRPASTVKVVVRAIGADLSNIRTYRPCGDRKGPGKPPRRVLER